VYNKNTQLSLFMVAKQVEKTEMFLNLYCAFLKENLHPIVMKGIICRQLYGKYEDYRPSGDEDILVKVDDFHKVRKVMEEEGFECEEPNITRKQLEHIHHVEFYHKDSGFLVEVHTNIIGNENRQRAKMNSYFDNVFEQEHVVDIKGVLIHTMNYTEHYIFVVLHAFKHFLSSGVGIRQVLDILLYQKRYESEIDWEIVSQGLKENQARDFLGDVQAIGTEYLGFVFQQQLPCKNPQILLEDILDVGVFGKRSKADELASRLNISTADTNQQGFRKWIRAGFPELAYMQVGAPYLVERPWLLPLEWLKRWYRFVKKIKSCGGSLLSDGIQQSKIRKELLDKYKN
jgi:hypothetical protein